MQRKVQHRISGGIVPVDPVNLSLIIGAAQKQRTTKSVLHSFIKLLRE